MLHEYLMLQLYGVPGLFPQPPSAIFVVAEEMHNSFNLFSLFLSIWFQNLYQILYVLLDL